MGLDISLYQCKNFEQAIANQAACEEFADEQWAAVGGYSAATEDQRASVRARITEFNATLNCDDWGASNEFVRDAIDSADSKLYPEHMFKLDYLRSSYNSGGINSVLGRCGCMDLYEIFEPNDGEYYVRPNWNAALVNVNTSIDQYTHHLLGPMAGYDAVRITSFGNGVEHPEDALALLKHELESRKNNKTGWGSYGNKDGDWFLDGIDVVGVVPNKGFGGGVYLLTKDKEVKKPEDDWYLQALHITKEMIENVLAQPNPDEFVLGWSS